MKTDLIVDRVAVPTGPPSFVTGLFDGMQRHPGQLMKSRVLRDDSGNGCG